MKNVKSPSFVVLSVVGLVFITIVVHESAHLIAALILRVPVIDFAWFDPRTRSPAITFGPSDNKLGITVVYYAGGLVTGALWLVVASILFIHRKHGEKSLAWWLVGLFVAMLAFWQIGQGILEGCLHQIYISGAAKPGTTSSVIQYLFMILGLLVYLRRTHLWRESLQKRSKVSN